MFGVDIHNPYTPNDVSAYTTGVRVDVPTDVPSPEVITKKICSATALRKVFAVDNYFSVRQNLIYSSYRSRGRENKLRREKYTGVTVLLLDSGFNTLRKRLIKRVIA